MAAWIFALPSFLASMKPRTRNVETMNVGGQNSSKKEERIHKRVVTKPGQHYDR
jgi:hypothetical protein